MHFLKHTETEPPLILSPPLYHNSLCHFAGVRVWQPLPRESSSHVQLSTQRLFLSFLVASQTEHVQNQIRPALGSRSPPISPSPRMTPPASQGLRLNIQECLGFFLLLTHCSGPLAIPVGSTFGINPWTDHSSPPD